LSELSGTLVLEIAVYLQQVNPDSEQITKSNLRKHACSYRHGIMNCVTITKLYCRGARKIIYSHT